SSERIFEVMVEPPSWPLSLVRPAMAALAASFALALAPREGFSGCAAAACAARRAAAIKLDDDPGSFGAAGISLIALSDAAVRSEGVATRPPGRVPGSSGWSGGNSGASAARAGAVCGSRISLIARGGTGGAVGTGGGAAGAAAWN